MSLFFDLFLFPYPSWSLIHLLRSCTYLCWKLLCL